MSGALESGKLLYHCPVDDGVFCVAFSPRSEDVVAFAGKSGAVAPSAAWMVHLADGSRVELPRVHTDGIVDLLFDEAGEVLITCGEDSQAIAWEIGDSPRVKARFPHDWQVRAASISPDGTMIATASLDRTVRVWLLETGEAITPPIYHAEQVEKVSFWHADTLISSCINSHHWQIALKAAEEPVEDLRRQASALAGEVR